MVAIRSAETIKSRGAPRSVIGDAAPGFQKRFGELLELMRRPGAMEDVLKDRQIPSVPVAVRVFHGCRLALARGKPWLAGKWDDVPAWSTKRAPMRVMLGDDGYLVISLPAQSILAESEGYKPADFDRLVEISGADGDA